MTSIAGGGGGSYNPNLVAAPSVQRPDTWDLAPHHPSSLSISETSASAASNQPLTMAADVPKPQDVHGDGPYGPVRGAPAPSGRGVNVYGGKNGTLLGQADPDAPRNPDGSMPVKGSGGVVGSLNSKGVFIPARPPKEESDKKDSADSDAAVRDIGMSRDSGGINIGSALGTVVHAVSSAANATGDAVASAAEAVAVPVGVATVIGGAAAVGVYALGGLAAIF